MKDIMVTCIIAAAIEYLLISFYHLSLTPDLWGERGRFIFIILFMVSSIVIITTKIQDDL